MIQGFEVIRWCRELCRPESLCYCEFEVDARRIVRVYNEKYGEGLAYYHPIGLYDGEECESYIKNFIN